MPERVTLKRDAAAKLRKEIRAMLRRGASYGEICAELSTSPATVARVVRELRDKGTDPRGSDAAELAALRADLEEAREEIARLRAQIEANPWRRLAEAQAEAQAAAERLQAALKEVGR